jgi:hypothetical protein
VAPAGKRGIFDLLKCEKLIAKINEGHIPVAAAKLKRK